MASVTIPNSVTSIEDWTFYDCDSLTSITIPNSVTSIGEHAFGYCSSLTSVTIPDSVTSIRVAAFYYCSSFTSVHITDLAAWCNIDFEDNSANPLSSAHNLYLNGELVKDLVIPNSVTSIGDYAFENCTSLTSLTIPDSVTSIGDRAFYSCRSLTSVTIPNSVTSIGESAFYGCTGLTSIICEPTTPPTLTLAGTYVFDNTNNCPIYVPSESIDVYKAAENWAEYADRIQAIQ